MISGMKYVGIDYGTKKVGIALSDESLSFAFPKEIVPTEIIIEYILALSQGEPLAGVVIGESVSNSGVDNSIADAAKLFAQKLETKLNIPIMFEREGYSSVEAHRYQTKKGDRDDSAAAIILQRFLDKRNVQQ